MDKTNSKLSSKKRYLQIALNSTIEEAYKIIPQLPVSDRILIEAGTPFIKRYGEEGIRQIKSLYELHTLGQASQVSRFSNMPTGGLSSFLLKVALKTYTSSRETAKESPPPAAYPYIVADLKMMDRGGTEVEIASRAGADAAVAMGHSPIESLNVFVQKCEDLGLDAMIDMMNVEYPLSVLRQLKKIPRVVILHRGVDEEELNKEKQIPLHEIRRVKGNYDILVAIAGGDTIREAQRAIFNDADIVVVWKSFYQSSQDTALLAQEFLKEIK